MNIYGLVTTALIPFSLVIQANNYNEKDLLNKLKTEVDKKNYANVLSLAKTYQDDYLGDPEFDFFLGIAALESNQVDVSVFAFERVVANKPNWLDAKLYLTKAYYQSSNYQAALEQCKSILSRPNIPTNLQKLTRDLCTSTENKLTQQASRIKHQLSANIGYDGNINAGTSEERIFLPFLNDYVNLDENSRELSDEYLKLNYQLQSTTALTQTSKININTQINAQQFANETDYNRLTAQVGVQYIQSFDAFDFNIGGQITPLWFDGEYYRLQSSVLTGVQAKLSDSWMLGGRLMLRKTSNQQQELLDTDDYSVGLTSHYYHSNSRYSVSIERLEEDGKVDSNSRTIDMISLSSLWLLNSQWLASMNVSYQRQEYRGQHPYYLAQREDDVWLASSFLQYQMSKTFSYRLSVNVQDKNSNLDLFSYRRSDINLSATMSF
ncbi:surface lipoprotein assembly modifier [Colwellia sp. 1_MG-2023]|uniref:tetratricopeptide repeat protein n=1 Tax=Colwellia sp. 1_MG-2023 TaxID=3062649 RepID=UPI0026E36CD7|nr:surface lipoprotein assembly modifier [Colwellia sp. 1_MG-2023]MDO6447053.1 surface lipoprotein assembly modifier [Colwellia sp. 1_MG-2023]